MTSGKIEPETLASLFDVHAADTLDLEDCTPTLRRVPPILAPSPWAGQTYTGPVHYSEVQDEPGHFGDWTPSV